MLQRVLLGRIGWPAIRWFPQWEEEVVSAEPAGSWLAVAVLRRRNGQHPGSPWRRQITLTGGW